MKRLVAGTVLTLAAALTTGLLPAPPSAGAGATSTADASFAAATQAAARNARAPRAKTRVVSREIAFDVFNTQRGLTSCSGGADEREYVVRARLVGPAAVVNGRGGVATFNVLVHDAGTGGWFWNLRGRPAQDYATQLARRGQTSVVLDRLGYDRSPLRDGDATCLDAQVEMLHQLIQHLYAGYYRITAAPRRPVTHAARVVVQGHGTGATIARLEAARYSDAQALVLMSPASTSPSAAALTAVQRQSARCAAGGGFAPYGASDREFRSLLFASARPAVQRAAAQRRNATPCGDVRSLAPTVLDAQNRTVDVPTLVLTGGADARGGGATGTTSPVSTARTVRRTFAGAGSALPLEAEAPAVRRAVLRFVRSLPRSGR